MGRIVRLAVAGIAVLGTLLGCGTETDPPDRDATSPGAASTESTARDTTAADGALSGLPVGDPPELAYVRSGTTVVRGDQSIDLDWEVVAIEGDLVYDEEAGAIYRFGSGGITLLSGAATAPPVTDSTVTWIENDTEIVRHYERAPERQPLPDGCCQDARLLGVDVDMDPDVFVVAPEGAWMWDTYEGREGLIDPPPDSQNHLWPVGGLGGGILAGVGISSEVLVEYLGGEWGWGYVAGPRDPASDAPVEYVEQERISAERVWLTSNAIIALDPDGQVVVLGSESRDDQASHHWRGLTGERTPLGLPHGLQVDGVVAENRRTVLVDATDGSGQRAWVRCHVGLFACALATELGADDIVPQQ